MTSPGAMRAHLHFTAFLFVLIGAVFALAAVLAPSLFSATAQAMAESGEEGADVGAALIAWTGRTVAIGGAVLSLPSLVCGWGLLRRRAWSRWLGIFLAALAVVYSPLLPVPFREFLVDRGYRLVEVPDEEFNSMGANVLALGPSRCVMVEGNPVTRRRLEAAGAHVVEYAGREISVKGGGGPTCLTRPLVRG